VGGQLESMHGRCGRKCSRSRFLRLFDRKNVRKVYTVGGK
jgi:hypothetical protein